MGCGTSKTVDPHALAAQGSVAGLAQWIDAGGYVDAVDSLQGRGSLLQVAARHDKVECLNLLLKCGADVDLTTPEHGTALHAAASAGASSIVPLLLDVGASTTIRFQGQTAADMAQQAGYPATASLIRMSHAHPPEHTSSGTSLGRNSSSFQRQQQQQQQLRLTQSQRERAAAQQQAAQQQETARRLREIHKQLVAAEAESRVGTTAGHAASPLTSRRASADPTGGGGNSTAPLLASSLGHTDNSAPQWQHVQRPSSPPLLSDTASLSNSLRLPSRQPSAAMQAALVNRQMPSDAELQDMLDRAQRQGAYRAGSNNASERSGRVAGRSSSSKLRQVSPPSPLAVAAQPDAADADDVAAGAAEGVAAGAAGAAEGVAGALPSALPAVGAASGPVLAGSQLPFTDPRRLTSLPRIDSSEIAEGIYGDGGGAAGPGSDSDSHDSSDEKSLADDPLMHFVRMAMTSKQPAALSSASPFAAAAQMCEPAASQTSEQQQQQQQHQQQQQQQQGSDTAQHTGNGVQSPAGPALPSAQLPTTPSVRLPVARSASLGSGSIALTPTAQRFRGGGSISLAVDIRPWEIQFEDLALQKTIGEGSFGKVYVAKWHETMVAVKVLLDLEEAQQAAGPEAAWTLSNPILCNLQKECGLMASLRHPNVVQFMGVSAMPPAMITEYCAKGSMADVLKAACKSPLKAAPLTWLRRLNMALDATKGMLYLHKRGIVHRDLKSPNLLVESTWKVKVADFNLSKIVEDTHSGSRSTAANMNPRWLAPEILNGEPATTASDVFSWGVVMWELLTFQVPWPHVSPWGLVGKLMDGLRLQVPPKEELPGPDNQHFVSFNEYVALMQRCWAQDPALRPCFEEVIVELRKMLEVQARSLER